jgi:fibronectin type 3 domain-containing protein
MCFFLSYLRTTKKLTATLCQSSPASSHAPLRGANRDALRGIVTRFAVTPIVTSCKTKILITLFLFALSFPNCTAQPSSTKGTVSQEAHRVTISFKESTSLNIVGYNVYRSTRKGGPYTRITQELLPPKTAYIDIAPVPHTTNYYVITSVNTTRQESTYSDELGVPIP